MKVTPVKRKFGRYAVGDEFELPDGAARLLIKVGKLKQALPVGNTYQTRMLTAAAPSEPTTLDNSGLYQAAVITPDDAEAPYGYKADGTPRKRPGRAPGVE